MNCRIKLSLVVLIYSLNAVAADTSAKCFLEFKQAGLRKIQSQQPSYTMSQLEEKARENPSAWYLAKAAEEFCQIKSVVSDFEAGQSSSYCPNQNQLYKISCFRDWLAQRHIGFAKNVAFLIEKTVSVATIDKKAGVDRNVLIPLLVDAELLLIENYVPKPNPSFSSSANPSVQKEWAGIQDLERQTLAKTKASLLETCEDKMKPLKLSLKEPAQNSAFSVWATPLIASLERRIQTLKSK